MVTRLHTIFQNCCQEDLECILLHTESLWAKARNAQFFITGGTGFFGKWLLESFHFINQALSLEAGCTILSRNPQGFLKKHPHILDYQDIQWLQGDVSSFDHLDRPIHYVIHGATEASVSLNQSQPLLMFRTIVHGTERTLETIKEHPIQGFLQLSSGAVYGEQPETILHLAESDSNRPNLGGTRSAYAEGKRAAEYLCHIYQSEYQIPIKIARCFAFVGPHLPLDQHFAIGNFMRNALQGSAISLTGDGQSVRSYLYAADLCIWLWTILLSQSDQSIFNVGSDEAISTLSLAKLIARQSDISQVTLNTNPQQATRTRYVPCIARAKEYLGLKIYTPLEQAIQKTMMYYREAKIGGEVNPAS